MEKIFFKHDDIKKENVGIGVDRKILAHGGQLMLVEVQFEGGALGYSHTHPHEQSTYIISGKFEFTVGKEVYLLKAGDSLYIPKNIEHGTKCLESGALLDIFTPQREDFLKNK